MSNPNKRVKYGANHYPAAGFTLPNGTQGFLLHCRMKKERRASDEIINLFVEHAEQFQPKETKETEPLELEFEKELLELQNKDKHMFKVIKTGITCCIFIKVSNLIGRP